VVVLAQDEARHLGHRHIGVEHLLIALAVASEPSAKGMFAPALVRPDDAREAVARIAGRGEGHHSGQMPFTPNARAALEDAARAAIDRPASTKVAVVSCWRHRAIARSEETLAIAVGDDPASTRPPVDEGTHPAVRADRLQRVIPVNQELGADLTVISVEAYADCLAVRWLRRGIAHGEYQSRWLTVTDDKGTLYGAAGESATGYGPDTLHGESLFTPALPSGARQLTIASGEQRIVVALKG
jgi:hypothetical protein